jgi:hypothetical protein
VKHEAALTARHQSAWRDAQATEVCASDFGRGFKWLAACAAPGAPGARPTSAAIADINASGPFPAWQIDRGRGAADHRACSKRPERAPMPKWLLYALVGGLILLALLVGPLLGQVTREISYSRFKQLITNRQVEQVILKGD